MKKIPIVIIMCATIFCLCACTQFQSYGDPHDGQVIKYSGKITSHDNGCYRKNGACAIEIDGKYWVLVNVGDMFVDETPETGPRGQIIDLEFLTYGDVIGKSVEIFAGNVYDRYYTIYGNRSYYVRVVPEGAGDLF